MELCSICGTLDGRGFGGGNGDTDMYGLVPSLFP